MIIDVNYIFSIVTREFIAMRVIIFDYDDTLFPSSHVAQHELYKTPVDSPRFVHHKDFFHELETAAICLLTKAIAVGDLVVIVTNAKLDWVRYSMSKFYHRLYDFVRKHETPVVSAQDIFSQKTPHPVMWKVGCFRQLLGSLRLTGNNPTMLVSIGDGTHEAIACEVTAREFGIHHRSVNFLDTPSPKQMTQQLYLLSQQLHSIVDENVLKSEFNAVVVSGGCIELHAGSRNILAEIQAPSSQTLNVQTVSA